MIFGAAGSHAGTRSRLPSGHSSVRAPNWLGGRGKTGHGSMGPVRPASPQSSSGSRVCWPAQVCRGWRVQQRCCQWREFCAGRSVTRPPLGQGIRASTLRPVSVASRPAVLPPAILTARREFHLWRFVTGMQSRVGAPELAEFPPLVRGFAGHATAVWLHCGRSAIGPDAASRTMIHK